MMWKRVKLNEREKNEEGKWVNTGEKVEMTEYTFRDEFGDTLVVLGSNEYRELEGREVELTLGINQRSFEGKTTNSLTVQAVTPAD